MPPAPVVRTVNVDRIEGQQAVLLDGEQQVNVPAAWLPEGAKEGSALTVRIEPAPAAEAAAGDRVQALQSRLGLRK